LLPPLLLGALPRWIWRGFCCGSSRHTSVFRARPANPQVSRASRLVSRKVAYLHGCKRFQSSTLPYAKVSITLGLTARKCSTFATDPRGARRTSKEWRETKDNH
jgi:hypothetical protein